MVGAAGVNISPLYHLMIDYLVFSLSTSSYIDVCIRDHRAVSGLHRNEEHNQQGGKIVEDQGYSLISIII